MKTTNEIKWIWWDLDDTLYIVPSEVKEQRKKIRIKLLAQITSKPESEELWQEFLKLYEKYGSNSAVFAALGKPIDFMQNEDDKINILYYLKKDKRTAAMFQYFSQLPIKHGLFTNNRAERAKSILHHVGIDPNLFSVILTKEHVKPKPSLEGFEKIIEISQVKPSEILFVGDRVKTELIPAKQVGMQTCLVWSEEKNPAADYVFPHVADVVKIFK
ncbi:MAG: HAD family hydrolase [Candidatus Micrarchaeota archaeon]